MSIRQFNKLAMLSARAFYGDDILPTDVDPGFGVVVFDALTRCKWVAEEVLADKLKLPFRQLQRTLRFFVAERLLTMEHREDAAKGAKPYGIAVAAANNNRRRGEEKINLDTRYYFCLDYAQMHDVMTHRLQQMRTRLTLGNFTGLLEKMEVQLKPLTDQLSRVKHLEAPDYGTLQEWELRASVVAPGSNSVPTGIIDSSRSGQGGTPMPPFGETEMHDGLSYRLQWMKKSLKDELDNKNTVQDIGDGDENARRILCEKLSENMEVELKLSRVEDIEAPTWGTIEQIEFERLPLKGLPRSMIKEKMIKEWKQKSKMEGVSASKDGLKGKRLPLPSTSRIRQRAERAETPTAGTATPTAYPPISRIFYRTPVHAPEIKEVIALLWKTGEYFTAEHIKDRCGVDVEGNMALFKSLASNGKVEYDQGVFSYKSKYNVRSRIELVQLIRRSPNGIPVADLEDAYPAAMEDLQALKACGDIWVLRNTDTRIDIAYTRLDACVPFTGVDDELKKLFRSVDLPSDLPEILVKNGLESKSAKRRFMAKNGDILNKPEEKK